MSREYKECSKCHRKLPFSMFHASNHGAKGLRSICLDCEREYNQNRSYSLCANIALDRVPWPFDDDSLEMDMEAIAEYKKEKRLSK